MDTSKEIFKIDKDIFTFNINSEKIKTASSSSHPTIISEEKLVITNTTNNHLSFRIKTTKKLFYTVNPSYFNISPKSSKTVHILFYFVPGNEVNSTGHKFKIEGFIITDDEKDKDAKELFSYYSKSKIGVEGNTQKRFVKLIYDNENENSAKNEEDNSLLKDKISMANSEYSIVQEHNEEKIKTVENNPFPMVNQIIKGETKKQEDIKDNNKNIEKNNEKNDNKKENSEGRINSGNENNCTKNNEIFSANEKNVPKINIILGLILSLLIGLYLMN